MKCLVVTDIELIEDELIKKKYFVYAHLLAIAIWMVENLIWREKYENVELLYTSIA